MKRLAFCLLLSGCATTPDVTVDTPKPPMVSECMQHRTPNLMPQPLFVWDLPEYLVTVVYTLTEERRLRGIERACIEQKRAKGVIR